MPEDEKPESSKPRNDEVSKKPDPDVQAPEYDLLEKSNKENIEITTPIRLEDD